MCESREAKATQANYILRTGVLIVKIAELGF